MKKQKKKIKQNKKKNLETGLAGIGPNWHKQIAKQLEPYKAFQHPFATKFDRLISGGLRNMLNDSFTNRVKLHAQLQAQHADFLKTSKFIDSVKGAGLTKDPFLGLKGKIGPPLISNDITTKVNGTIDSLKQLNQGIFGYAKKNLGKPDLFLNEAKQFQSQFGNDCFLAPKAPLSIYVDCLLAH